MIDADDILIGWMIPTIEFQPRPSKLVAATERVAHGFLEIFRRFRSIPISRF